MGSGLIQLGGSKLSGIINALTKNRVMGVLVGALVTAVIQSSSATTVIVVGLINAGLMNLGQSIGIILGANIGTTITAQIIAFKLTDYALLFIALGFLIVFIAKSKKKKHAGEILLGFGLLFYGIKIMGDAMVPIRTYEPFIAMMQTLENPLMGVLVGAIFTALVQSSSASTGVFITLSFQGILSLKAAIPLTFGANIGTCITAVLAAINANREARRAAIAHTLFNVLSTVIFLPFLAQYQALIEWMSGGMHATTQADIIAHVPRQIANAHSVAKIIAVVLFLPFTEHLARWSTWCLPVKPETEGEKFKTKYISDDALAIPSTALSLAKQEILRMAYSTKSMLEVSINLITKKDGKVAEIIRRSDDKVDRLNYEIRNYLTRIAQNLMEEEESKTQTSYMYIISNIEHIGDLLSKEMLTLGEKYIHRDARLNEEDLQNIGKFHAMVDDLFARVLTAYKDDDQELLESILSESERRRIVGFENEIKRHHFAALTKGCRQAEATTSVFLDLLNDYHAVFSHLLAIAHGQRGDF
jgi:phosphate:Na+ symporter